MTPKFSLITVVAVAALTVGVPTAFSEGRLAGSQEPALATPDPMIEDGFAQAVARSLELNPAGTYRDAHERGAVQNQGLGSSVGTYRDANERAVVQNQEPQWLKALMARSEGLNRQYGLGEFAQSTTSPSQRAEMLRSEGLNRLYGLGEFATTSSYRDSHERASVPPTVPAPVSITPSGSDIEWPTVGIGFGIGIVLLLGLALALKATHTRPFAH